jgi:hypothetical protein
MSVGMTEMLLIALGSQADDVSECAFLHLQLETGDEST